MPKPGLTLHRLELFLAVLDAGGVARGLAAHFGVALLERHGRGVRPTAAARTLEPFARQVIGLVRGAERSAEELRGIRAGALTVGASTTPGTYLLPSALGAFHAAYPAVTLSLRIGDTRELERWVATGEIEPGVIGEAPLVPGLAAELWVQDEL